MNKYLPATVHRTLIDTESVSGWVDSSVFFYTYRQLSKEGQNCVDEIISKISCWTQLGILGAAELVWWYLKNEKEYKRNEYKIEIKPTSIEQTRKE